MDMEGNQLNQCFICDKVYALKKDLYRHQNAVHGVHPKPLIECDQCGFQCKLKRELESHIKTHNTHMRLQCSFENCEEKFSRYTSLHNHISAVHQIHVRQEQHVFDSVHEFNEWKKTMEAATNSMYVRDTGVKRLRAGEERMHYVCHRSYSPRMKPCSKRNRKHMGTNKMGVTCPSILNATIASNKVTVYFYPDHIGHVCEIGRMRIPKEDRQKIAGRLVEGVPEQRVLEDVRKVHGHETLKRVHLLEKKDIHNIKRDFSISYATKRHPTDAVSVKLWVQDMKTQEENPVLYFKEQGTYNDSVCLNADDFVLIIMTDFQKELFKKFGSDKVCVDGTHGLNSYNFQLFTLMVVDEYGSGLPVAFCFSNRSDGKLFLMFFEKVKEQVGCISPRVFMTDDEPAFYRAWKMVMGPTLHLLCAWHVNRNWLRNLPKIKDKEMRAHVFQKLQLLRNETDKDKFLEDFQNFLGYLINNEDTKLFADYITKYYANRTEQWAYCFRAHLGINTNMYLESLHKTIKYCYLKGKKCRRMDKSINALLSLVRDKIFERIIKISKKKASEKIKKILESHKKSSALARNITLVDERKWYVTSEAATNQRYVVEKSTAMCLENCALKCKFCNICIHNFKCSCPNNLIYLNICKHIHACAQLSPNSKIHCQEVGEERETKDMFQLAISSEEAVSEREEIRGKLQLLLCLNNKVNLNASEASTVKRHLEKAISVLSKGQKIEEIDQGNSSKNIERQARFFSTKKVVKKRIVTV